jgi:hypothetical protein
LPGRIYCLHHYPFAFIIDTSGSMKRFAWPLVNRKVAEVLKIYPRVKAIQVMNDMGAFQDLRAPSRWAS